MGKLTRIAPSLGSLFQTKSHFILELLVDFVSALIILEYSDFYSGIECPQWRLFQSSHCIMVKLVSGKSGADRIVNVTRFVVNCVGYTSEPHLST